MSPLTQRSKTQYGTYLVVTVITLLIWIWAAGETRNEDTVYARVKVVTSLPLSAASMIAVLPCLSFCLMSALCARSRCTMSAPLAVARPMEQMVASRLTWHSSA